MDGNKYIIHQIVRAILFLGKQGRPFHGDNEGRSTSKDPGYFLALLRVLLRVILFNF